MKATEFTEHTENQKRHKKRKKWRQSLAVILTSWILAAFFLWLAQWPPEANRQSSIINHQSRLPSLLPAAQAQAVKTFRDYARLAQGNDDVLLLVTYDPNGTPATYSIGLDELVGYKNYMDWDTDTASPSNGDTTHVSTADQIYDWVIGLAYGTGDMLKSTYDVSADGHVDGNDVAYSAAWNGDVNAPSMNALYDEMETKEDALTDKASLESSISDVSDFAEADGDIYTGVHDFGGAASLEVPNDESADAALTALGQVHIRGDEDRYSMHFGAGGEIAGEATMSGLKKISATFDPGSWYDSSAYVNLGPILAKQYPNGIIIDYWAVTCHLDPDVEMDMDLCYSVNSFDLADPNLVDVMDTTNGLSFEDTDANINGGAAIPAGVYLYLRFGADPEGTCQMLTTTILYHGEED